MNNTMKTAHYKGNRQFEIRDAQIAAPNEGEVAIKVAYCGICGTDMHAFHGNMDGRIGLDRILGHEMSGTISEIGKDVTGFQKGDKVVVRPLMACGSCPACDAGYSHICHKLKFMGLDTDGAMQGVWVVPAYTLHKLPKDMRLDHAALIEPVAVACHDVRLSELKAGEDAVVIGGGPIGILVALVARQTGANVIITEVNANRVEKANEMGFEALNPLEVNLVDEVNRRTKDKGADVVFEVSGSQAGVDTMTDIAATRGRIVMVAIHAKKPQIDLFRFFWRELKMLGARVYEPQDYEKAIQLVAENVVDGEVIITDRAPLREIQRAFEALDSNPTALKSLLVVGD